MDLRTAIRLLLSHARETDDKLSLLTDLTINTDSDELTAICEDLRYEIVETEELLK